MLPGDVYYYAANSSVICVGRRPKRQLQACRRRRCRRSILQSVQKWLKLF